MTKSKLGNRADLNIVWADYLSPLILLALLCFFAGCDKSSVKQSALPIDAIKGFESIAFGNTYEQLSARLIPYPPGMGSDNNGIRRIAQLTEEEKMYGDVPVKQIEVWFSANLAHKVVLKLNSTGEQLDVLQKAFTLKYGAPVQVYDGNLATVKTWRGNDVEVQFTRYNTGMYPAVEFSSLILKRMAKAKEEALKLEEENRRNERAKKLSPKL